MQKKTKTQVGDATAYSLILRLRTIYIIDCIRKKKIWKKSELLNLIKKISGSLSSYDQYLKVKNNKKKREFNLKIEEAEKLREYILNKTKGVAKWLKEKRD